MVQRERGWGNKSSVWRRGEDASLSGCIFTGPMSNWSVCGTWHQLSDIDTHYAVSTRRARGHWHLCEFLYGCHGRVQQQDADRKWNMAEEDAAVCWTSVLDVICDFTSIYVVNACLTCCWYYLYPVRTFDLFKTKITSGMFHIYKNVSMQNYVNIVTV